MESSKITNSVHLNKTWKMEITNSPLELWLH